MDLNLTDEQQLIQQTAREWLRRENRTVYTIIPGAPAAPAGGTQ